MSSHSLNEMLSGEHERKKSSHQQSCREKWFNEFFTWANWWHEQLKSPTTNNLVNEMILKDRAILLLFPTSLKDEKIQRLFH